MSFVFLGDFDLDLNCLLILVCDLDGCSLDSSDWNLLKSSLYFFSAIDYDSFNVVGVKVHSLKCSYSVASILISFL